MTDTDRFGSLVSPFVRELEPYVPGKPIEELQRERGFDRVVKLASNENPLGPSPRAVEAARRAAAEAHRYPDGFGRRLKEALAARWGVGVENLVLGNGSSEVIEMAVRLLVRPGSEVVVASPSFSIYELTARAQGGTIRSVPLKDHRVDLEAVARAVGPATALVILGNPNNPTGTAFTAAAWERFWNALPEDVAVVLDEAYAEYADDPGFPDGARYVGEDRPLLVVRTFSKAYGLALLRMGYGIAPAGLVDYLNRLRLPFNANGVAQAAAVAALEDGEYLERARRVNREGRERLYAFFSRLGLEYLESQANFVAVRVGDGDAVYRRLLDHGVIVRSIRSFGMPEWIRVTVGLPEELDRFETAFAAVLKEG
ncbi:MULTISPECIES: pyridoxal phosphate-dependent aminotransferase [Deferrisoma]